jgi:hypothetical protein
MLYPTRPHLSILCGNPTPKYGLKCLAIERKKVRMAFLTNGRYK